MTLALFGPIKITVINIMETFLCLGSQFWQSHFHRLVELCFDINYHTNEGTFYGEYRALGCCFTSQQY